MEDYVRTRHIQEGFQYVSTHISKEDLFYTSGHLPYYAAACSRPWSWTTVTTAEGRRTARYNEIYTVLVAVRTVSCRCVSSSSAPCTLVMTRVRRATGADRVRMITRMTRTRSDQGRHRTRCIPAEFMLSLLEDFGMTGFLP